MQPHMAAQEWPVQQGQPYVYTQGPVQQVYAPGNPPQAGPSASATRATEHVQYTHDPHALQLQQQQQHYQQQQHHQQQPQAYYATPPAPTSTVPGGPSGAGQGYGAPGPHAAQGQGMLGQPVQTGGWQQMQPPPPPPTRSPYPPSQVQPPPPRPPSQVHRPPSRPPSIAHIPLQQQHPQMLHAQSTSSYGNSLAQPHMQGLPPGSSAALMSPTAHRFNSNPSAGPPPPPPQQQQQAYLPQPQHAPAPPLQPHPHHGPNPAPHLPHGSIPTAAGLEAHLARLDEAAQVQHHAAQLEAVLKRGAYLDDGPRAGQPITPDQHAQIDRQVHDLRNREMSILTTCETFVRAHGGANTVSRFVEQYRANVQRQQQQQQQQQHNVQQDRRAATMQVPPHAQGYPPPHEQVPPRPASATPHVQLHQHVAMPHQRTHTYPQQQQPAPAPPPPLAPQHSQGYTTLPPNAPGISVLQQHTQPQYQPSPPRQPPPQVHRAQSSSAMAQQHATQAHAHAHAQRHAQQQQHAQAQAQAQVQSQSQAQTQASYARPPSRQQPTPVPNGPAQRAHPHPHAPPDNGGGGGGQPHQDPSAGLRAHMTAATAVASREMAQRQLAAAAARAQQTGQGQVQMQGQMQGLGQGQGPGQGPGPGLAQAQPGCDGRGAAWDEAQRRERDEHERREREREQRSEQAPPPQQQQQQQQSAGLSRAGVKHPTQVLAEGQPGWPSLPDLQAQVTAQVFWETLRQVIEKRGQRLDPRGFFLDNRPIDLYRLSQVVIGQFGGYVRSDFDKSWMHIASQFGFSPSSPAPGQLRDLYMRIVGPYEDFWSTQEVKKLRVGGAQQHPQQQQMLVVNGARHVPQHFVQHEQDGGAYTSPPSAASSSAPHLPFVPSASGVGLVNAAVTPAAQPVTLALPPQPTYAVPQHASPPEQSLSSIFANSFAAFPLAPSSTVANMPPVQAPARSPEPTVQELIAQSRELQREHLADRAAAEAASPTKGGSSPRKLAGLPAPSSSKPSTPVADSPRLQTVSGPTALSPQTSSTPGEQLLPEPPAQASTSRLTAAQAASVAGQVAPFTAPPALLRRTPSGAPYLSPSGSGPGAVAGGSPPLSRAGSSSRKRERTHEPNEPGQADEDAGRRKREGTGTFADPGAATTTASTKAQQHLVVPAVGASPGAMETPDLVASRALRPDSATSASTSTSVSPRSSRALSISTGSAVAPMTPGPSSAAPLGLPEVATPVHAALAASAGALSLGTPTSANPALVPPAAPASTAGSSDAATDPLASLSFTTPVSVVGFEASPALFGGSGWGDSAVPSYGVLDASTSSTGLGGWDLADDAGDIFASFAAATSLGGGAGSGAGKTPALGASLDDDGWTPAGLLDMFATDFASHS